MIKKIDISSLNKIPSQINMKGKDLIPPVVPMNDDEFIKSKTINSPLIAVNKFLTRVNYSKMMKNLITTQYWTDGMNFVDIAPRENVIKKVGVGLFDKKNADVTVHSLSVEDFSGILTNVTAANILKHPENEASYKNLFLELINYIKSHYSKE